jgi:galactose-1-phosphate uridylyltransferase
MGRVVAITEAAYGLDEGETMQVGTIDVKKLRFVADKGLGVSKEVMGVLVGSARLQEEGESQQERATAELKALRNEVQAQKHEAKAMVFENQEKAAQNAK